MAKKTPAAAAAPAQARPDARRKRQAAARKATRPAAPEPAAPEPARARAGKDVRRATTPAASTRAAPAASNRAAPAAPARPTRALFGSVVEAIEASPVGKAAALTEAVLRSRRAAQLGRRVRDHNVVVTGATSGIGRDCAFELAAAGANVILAARTPGKLEETVERIRAEGGQAHAYACDLADPAACERFVQAVLDAHGPVEILINNAGRSIRRSVANSFDRFHDYERTMQLNYFGALKLIFGFAPAMLERRSGHIVNISSIGVLASPPRFSAYVASKAALDAFSWCAAPEFADRNVRFTTINMPLVRTPMIAPTKLYDAFPALTPAEAAALVMDAVIHRPKRVVTGLGLAGAMAQALAPGLSEFVLNRAFRLFPESAAAAGMDEAEAAALPTTPAALARRLYAQVFGGVYW